MPSNEPATIAPPSSVATTALTAAGPGTDGDGCDPIGIPQSTTPGGTPASGGCPMGASKPASGPISVAVSKPASSPDVATPGGNGRALHAIAAAAQAARAQTA